MFGDNPERIRSEAASWETLRRLPHPSLVRTIRPPRLHLLPSGVMTDTQQESIEDNQQAFVDSASSCLVIAAPVLLDCGRHEEEWLDPIFTSSGYMEHVTSCMGMDVSVLDGLRLILDRVVDGTMSLDEPEEASCPETKSKQEYIAAGDDLSPVEQPAVDTVPTVQASTFPLLTEDERYSAVDVFTYSLNIATAAIHDCGLHGKHHIKQNFYHFEAYKDHFLTCLHFDLDTGMAAFDSMRFYFDRNFAAEPLETHPSGMSTPPP